MRAEAGSTVSEDTGPAHFQVDHTFNVRGVGTVMSGTVVAGHIGAGDTLMMGPTPSGGFADVTVTGIHRAQVPQDNCSLALATVRVGQCTLSCTGGAFS